jgi:hypothetical protein
VGRGRDIWVNKVPHVSLYAIEKTDKVDLSGPYLVKKRDRICKLRRDRIIVKVLRGNKLTCAFAPKNILTTEKLVNLVITGKELSPFYVLALLNSRLVSFWFAKAVFSEITETSRVMDDCYLSKAPVRQLNGNDQKPFVSRVKKILELTKATGYRADNTRKRKVEVLVREIDKLVYKLYGLSREEVETVEKEIG